MKLTDLVAVATIMLCIHLYGITTTVFVVLMLLIMFEFIIYLLHLVLRRKLELLVETMTRCIITAKNLDKNVIQKSGETVLKLTFIKLKIDRDFMLNNIFLVPKLIETIDLMIEVSRGCLKEN